jgi:trimethylamine:corrinoid methyltransferase-like protein
MALDLLLSLSPGDHLLTDAHTIKWFRQEILTPGKSIDRRARGSDQFEDLDTAEARANQEVERILSEESEPVLSGEVLRELEKMMKAELKKAGANGLPA